jgi:hypothetical protein
MKQDRQAVALIFDALAFLTIVTIVAVVMMQMVRVDQSRSGIDKFTGEVHEALLDRTFVIDGNATAMSMIDAIRTSFSNGNLSLRQMVMEQVESTLQAYLEPEYRFEWTADLDGTSYRVGDLPDNGAKLTIYVSVIHAQAAGSEMTMTLRTGY